MHPFTAYVQKIGCDTVATDEKLVDSESMHPSITSEMHWSEFGSTVFPVVESHADAPA